MHENPQRILVVGPTGSGKTTVARYLSERYQVPHVELDALHWGPNWTIQEDFLEEVDRAIAESEWVIEGGYVTPIRGAWPHADLVVWLDYPFPTILYQLLKRTFVRRWRSERIFNDNRESLRTTFFSRNSLILWLFQTYDKRKRLFAELAEEHPEVRVERLTSRRQISIFQ